MMFKKFKSLSKTLNRSEMKHIMGGYGGSCGYRTPNGYYMCGLTMAEAQHMASSPGYYWCCSSCASNGGSASYC